ncbi:restriction endonuclease [Tenacibaculum ovolyticum]|uniref:5-methylcytosine restriction system specificity protein McrC n=1 Tax=Tenacibaculum ovolyticum TaxID=104270 RepID=UPI0022F3D4B4|nr:restriction endonuclease [Tenacibaculum ovolyticum]WBX78095.1 restriction endonuclease [Tenacibaculum ovolyticum]
MIVLSEHTGYSTKEPLCFSKEDKLNLDQKSFNRFFKRKLNEQQLCYHINFDNDTNEYSFESSYMVGVDWVVPNKVSIQVIPKLNKEETEINFLAMLFEALEETENLKHLEGLCEIDFKSPKIPIEQKQDVLTPLLVIQFLSVLQSIIKKGLKKSYYKVEENLNGSVKGKINIANTIKQNHSRAKLQFTNCSYDEFGLNSLENKVLKKALLFSKEILNKYLFLKENHTCLINFVSSSFENISSEVSIKEIKNRRKNRFYKEYDTALTLAEQILKKYDYNITKTSERIKETYPFWIDMSKLFELYVFKKLRETYPKKGEITYHKKFHGLEPDYLLNTEENGNKVKMIIDAKYKPKYKDSNIYLADARQVSGYARLKSIYTEFELKRNKELIDCLIVYSDQSLTNDISFKKLIENKKEDGKYLQLYKVGVKLPEI